MNTSANFYNRFYRLYPVVDFFLKGQKQYLVKYINQLPKGNLLEIGVGNGSVLPLYQKHYITGIDTAGNMLKVARTRRTNTTVALLNMNGEALKFPDASFDYIVISHVLSVTAHPENMLRESHRVLKPGGLLLIHNHFTPSNLLQYMDRFFSLLAPIFRFRSVFKISDLESLKSFSHQRQITVGIAQYFKILILEK
jgi:phosphatidylethanolamine/phosphatidyl-N-methylethanolamine N-methyltransferase